MLRYCYSISVLKPPFTCAELLVRGSISRLCESTKSSSRLTETHSLCACIKGLGQCLIMFTPDELDILAASVCALYPRSPLLLFYSPAPAEVGCDTPVAVNDYVDEWRLSLLNQCLTNALSTLLRRLSTVVSSSPITMMTGSMRGLFLRKSIAHQCSFNQNALPRRGLSCSRWWYKAVLNNCFPSNFFSFFSLSIFVSSYSSCAIVHQAHHCL